MQSNKKSSKRDVPKISIPAEVVAEAVGCSTSYVKRVRRGAIDKSTETTEKIVVAEELFSAGTNALVKAVANAVKL